MELDEIYQQIDLVGKQELEANKQAREEGVEEAEVVVDTTKDEPAPQPTDVYNERRRSFREQSEKGERHGSDPLVNIALEGVLQTLRPQYHKTKGMVKHLRKMGQLSKAEAVRNQYMMDYYLPGVEAIIAETSPDDLLNNDKAMEILDEYSLSLGDAKGYLKGYLLKAYGDMLGQKQGESDEMIQNAVRQMSKLGAEGEVREAIALAKRTQHDIDSGLNVASQDDYELILKVANA